MQMMRHATKKKEKKNVLFYPENERQITFGWFTEHARVYIYKGKRNKETVYRCQSVIYNQELFINAVNSLVIRPNI